MSVNFGSVYVGDNKCCNIVGIGEVRIKMYDGTVRTLCDVRHIPYLKKNLISLGTLHKNGFIRKADDDRETIRIVKGALTVMKGKITAGNIYRLLGSTVLDGSHSVESYDDNTKLWSMRLGHLSERRMVELHKRNLLHGVKSCKKSEVFAKFKLWKAEVENQTGRKIKYLRSDNERMNMSLNERARCLRLNAGLPKSFWAEAARKYNRECDMISIFFQTPLDQKRVKPRPKTISRADPKPKHTKSTWSTSLSREKSCFIKITLFYDF
ncbi:hypothetical protein V6N12_050297 [Hibiscus sabdariffa]|uniref:GAG-pre-integrase domain-containing protein n=1 Tax=Hibiscus sabdariffa TaxID=183260 RepID=A0ABR2GBZ1_9ROSI